MDFLGSRTEIVNTGDPVESVKEDEDRIMVTEINRTFVNSMENIPLRRRVVWPYYECYPHFITVHNRTDTGPEYRYDRASIGWKAWRPCPLGSDCTR